MVRFACSWCGRPAEPVEGSAVFCPGCGHRSDLTAMDCDCPACAASDPGFVIRYSGRGKFLEVLDAKTGERSYTADAAKARVFRGEAWRRIWSGHEVTIIPVAPVVAVYQAA
jgi:predicted amidophosphoribosyltransferase